MYAFIVETKIGKKLLILRVKLVYIFKCCVVVLKSSSKKINRSVLTKSKSRSLMLFICIVCYLIKRVHTSMQSLLHFPINLIMFGIYLHLIPK